MKKNDKKNLTLDKPHPPNKLLYKLLIPFCSFLIKVAFKVKVHKEDAIKTLKGPFLAIGTHSSVLDFLLMMGALLPHRLNMIGARDLLAWKSVKPFVKIGGVIPMSQFAMNINSVRLMKKALEIGCNLALFPEGKISLDGRQLHCILQNIAKLLKFLNVPIVMCHNNGGYLSLPKWAVKFRRGKIQTTVKLLFTVEELQSMNIKDIYSRIKSAFAFNDHIYQRDNRIRFKTKAPAKGLHYILYKCSRCGAEYEMRTTDNEIICDACNNTIEYTEYGEMLSKPPSVVRFKRIDQWYDYQRESIKKLVSDESFFESHPVVWEVNSDGTYKESGEGDLYINTTEIGFIGKDFSGKPVTITFPLKFLYTIVQKASEAVDLTIDDIVHRFYFREGKYSVKYTLIIEESYKRIHGI
ncbi:MAG: 1-acyl-sn-glycerol-3-phosphate acyltransferase [Christensenellaceae bacterium]|jgi:1-acyl-sn-glycerol-3-phosphate acyltransferase|nr:1-acyl-sn-glycerol-3-phosphate acyltransferase [Christensenellaceae bacterium]